MLLFLQGERRVGKSTVLWHKLLPYEKCVAGLLVQRLWEGEDQVGYRACPIKGSLPSLEIPYDVGLAGVFLYRGSQDMAALEQAAAEALEHCKGQSCRLVLLDEVGGIELTSNPFMRALHQILSLGKPCIGVVKSVENLEGIAGRFGLMEACLPPREALVSAIEAKGKLLTMTKENAAEIEARLDGFLETAL